MGSMQDAGAYGEVNRKWKATAKLLFGGEVGEMKEYEGWLSDINTTRAEQKDASGREIVLPAPHYSRHARYVSFEDVDFGKKYPPLPLSINEIKDIDSLLEAVRDRICYTGNIVLGDSKFVEKSTGVIDSFYIYHCDRVAYSKYLAYSAQSTSSEHMFGCNGFGSVSFCVKITGMMYSSRCFECSDLDYSTDCYYSHRLAGCQDCMFSFNLRSKRHAIGNLELPPDKYRQLKAKLVGEMREMLVRDKRLPSLISLCGVPVQNQSELKKAVAAAGKPRGERQDKAPIEKAFADTARLVFGKAYGPMDRYGEWLGRCTAGLREGASCASGKRLLVPQYLDYPTYPRNRLVSEEEAPAMGENLRVGTEEAERLSMRNAAQGVSKIAFFCPSRNLGVVRNAIDAVINFDSNNCYRNVLNINAKYTAFGYWARDSEYLFGGNEVRNSAFCMNCYHSAKLQRCFEVDASRDCSDCYYCHNCENVHDSMFCFNVKNLRYAIGNVEVGREKYLEVKARLLAQLNGELEKNSCIGTSIFTLLEKKK